MNSTTSAIRQPALWRLRRGQRTVGRAGAFTPDAIAVGARHLEVGGEHVASFGITGYPREVHPGWLQPLLGYPGRLDVARAGHLIA